MSRCASRAAETVGVDQKSLCRAGVVGILNAPPKGPERGNPDEHAHSTAPTVILLFVLAAPVQAQAPLPAGWPNRLELGMGDGPGGAAAMKATAPFAFRYQYLAGGVNTGNGWATWNPNGDFARYYIQDSVAQRHHPVFTYYMMLQSLPGGGSPKADASSPT